MEEYLQDLIDAIRLTLVGTTDPETAVRVIDCILAKAPDPTLQGLGGGTEAVKIFLEAIEEAKAEVVMPERRLIGGNLPPDQADAAGGGK